MSRAMSEDFTLEVRVEADPQRAGRLVGQSERGVEHVASVLEVGALVLRYDVLPGRGDRSTLCFRFRCVEDAVVTEQERSPPPGPVLAAQLFLHALRRDGLHVA